MTRATQWALPTVWVSSLRMVWIHAIEILIHKGDGSPALVPPEVLFGLELGEYCTLDGFYMHQVPLACMVVLDQASQERGPLGSGVEYSVGRSTEAPYSLDLIL